MKKQVLESTCDGSGCEVVVITPFEKNPRRATLDLPKGWLHVSASTATSTVFEKDLCDSCKAAVLAAAGRANLQSV